MRTLFTLLFFAVSMTSFAQAECKFLKDCQLRYDDGNEGTITIKGDKHVETFKDGTFIKSDLKWVNDCEYIATMTEITLPNFPLKPGVVMNVKFEKIDGDKITGTATIGKDKYPIKFVRIK